MNTRLDLHSDAILLVHRDLSVDDVVVDGAIRIEWTVCRKKSIQSIVVQN